MPTILQQLADGLNCSSERTTLKIEAFVGKPERVRYFRPEYCYYIGFSYCVTEYR